MENLPARVPHTLFPDLVAAFVPGNTPPDAALELVITIGDQDILTRELALYLALIDRLYGRLSQEGLRSYAHREVGHLSIAEIHKSDVEIIFRTLYGDGDTARFIAILLFLRCLPNMFKLTSEGVKYLSDAFKSYQEGLNVRDERRRKEDYSNDEARLARENRKHIREVIREEPALEKLDRGRKSQLVRFLDALIVEENKALPAAIRFARHQVIAVVLRVRKH